MKNYLSVEVDENGMFHLTTDLPQDHYEQYRLHPERGEEELVRLMDSFIHCFWGENNPLYMQIIRFIFMAGATACAEPYCEAEEMWSTLMFSFIPDHEKHAAKLKRRYGFDDRNITRPFTEGSFPGNGLWAMDLSRIVDVDNQDGGARNMGKGKLS